VKISKQLTCLALLVALTGSLHAADGARAPGLVVTSENDLYGNVFGYNGQDRHYTQGLKFMYIGGDKDFTGITSKLTKFVPTLGLRDEACNAGFSFGQNIYTPIDKSNYAPIPNDWPYAGWLYGGLIFQRRGVTFNGIPTLDSYELDLGVIGSSSLAGETQRIWHKWIGSGRPNGWANQLKNEPGLELKAARYWRFTPNEKVGRYIDVVAHVGTDLGNVRVDANAGALLRIGINLPQDFGVSLIEGAAPSIAPRKTEKGDWFSLYIFGGGEGRAIGHDIFLDGNTFAHSLNVNKEPLVGDFMFGAGFLLFQHLEASFTGVIRSSQFETQRGGADTLGSITIKLIFGF
jgi:hypothetical protein